MNETSTTTAETKPKSKKWLPIVVGLVIVAGGLTPIYLAQANNKSGSGIALFAKAASPEDRKAAYAVGYKMGDQSKTQMPEFNVESFAQAIKAAYADKKPKYSEEEMKGALEVMQKKQGKGLTEIEGRKAAYAIGFLMGKDNKTVLPNLDVDTFTDAFGEGFAGSKAKYSEEEMLKAIADLQKKSEAEMAAKAQKMTAENDGKGSAYLATNAKKAGVTVTKTGLQVETLKAGTGASPKAADQVKVHYEGRLIDGTVFDTSYGKEPITFPLAGVIPGWTEGLQLMKEGGKSRFTIPAAIAYGAAGAGSIPPNSTLVFEVELIKVNP